MQKSGTAVFLIWRHANGVTAYEMIALLTDDFSLRLLESIGVIDCDCGMDATKRGRDATKKEGDVSKNKEVKDRIEDKERKPTKLKISSFFYLEL